MNAAPEPERTLVEYLLGRLPEPERVQLEEHLFEDDALDEQLVATTDDLIHAYLRGELTPEDRRQFEDHFLAAPDHRERLQFMRGLVATLGAPAPPHTSPRGFGWLAAAAATLVVGGAVVISVRSRGTDRPSLATSVPAAATPTALAGAPSGADVLVVRVSRKGGAPVVRVSDQTRVVHFEVEVDETSPSFDATIRAPSGAVVWKAEGLVPPAGAWLSLEVPAQLLDVARGAYALRVVGESLREGAAPVVDHRLEVVRQGAGASPPSATASRR